MDSGKGFRERMWELDCATHNRSEQRKKEDTCKRKWHEEEMRGCNKSKFFCVKCDKELPLLN